MTTATRLIKVGDTVQIKGTTFPDTWWSDKSKLGKVKPSMFNGTVEKVFQNGKLAVAIKEMKNRSKDGMRTMNILRSSLADTFYTVNDESPITYYKVSGDGVVKKHNGRGWVSSLLTEQQIIDNPFTA